MTTQLEAFPLEAVASQSPRLAWLTRNRLITRLEKLPRYHLGCPQNSRPWLCSNVAMTLCFCADTELEATQKAAHALGIKHWMEEELESQLMLETPKITVSLDEEIDEWILLATSYGSTTPAGPRLFRADPPAVQFAHAERADAERDAAVLQKYLDAVWQKKGKK